MSTPSDLTLSGPALIYDLINTANALGANPASASTISLGTPVAIDPAGDPAGHNTQMTLSAVAGKGYSGSVDITYNRLDIQSQVMAVKAPSGAQVEDTGSFATLADLLPSINSAYGLNLGTADLTSPTGAVPAGSYPIPVNLAIAAGSYAYLGTLAVDIIAAAIPLSTAISTTSMDGLSL